MSHKGTEDKERDGYPFTARQKRRKLGNRTSRKQARNGRIAKKLAKSKGGKK